VPETDTTEVVQLSRNLSDAVELARQVHVRQVRKGTHIPYLAHLLAVAALVLEAGGDESCAIAAVLHDAVEDSEDGEKSLAKIRSQFSEEVAEIVRGCSDTVAQPGQPKPPWRDRKEAYLRHLAEADDRVVLVSLCDKLHNLRAILADLRNCGNALWARFSVGQDQVLWYYRSLVNVFRERRPGALADELARTYEEVCELAAAAPRPHE
jgi:GTP pyrophosphokinase